MAVDFYVGRVLAIEPIFTSRVTILYAVESGGPFTADRTSGIISTTELLSASLHNIDIATREYVLTISATFVSFSPLVINDKISYTTMIVGIIPKFLAPVFTLSAYYAALDYGFNSNEELLQAVPGQLVTIITAKPEERFLNQVRIVYSLVSSSPFFVNSSSGEITWQGVLAEAPFNSETNIREFVLNISSRIISFSPFVTQTPLSFASVVVQVGCPILSIGVKIPSGCRCKYGYVGAVTNTFVSVPSTQEIVTSPFSFINRCALAPCTPDCRCESSLNYAYHVMPPNAEVCHCNSGYRGSISVEQTLIEDLLINLVSGLGYSSSCVAEPCPVNSFGAGGSHGCTCNPGYKGSVAAAVGTIASPLYYNSTCTRATCPMNVLTIFTTDLCICKKGYSGLLTKSTVAPAYFDGLCTAASCPTYSSGGGGRDGCICNPGFQGTVTPIANVAPFYSSTCQAVSCPSNSQGSLGVCSCVAGYEGTVIAISVFPYYNSTCVACKAGFAGIVVPIEGNPFYNSTCVLVPCPVNSSGPGGVGGCTCLPGYSGNVQATTTGPMFYLSTCSPALCPIASHGAGGTDGCVCNAGYTGLVLATIVGPSFFSSTCLEALCPPNSHGLGGAAGCTCNAGKRGVNL